ncbi:MAG TPA: PsiF family protein [Stenotrophobium sp.]|nr:PsiF family protein [Stenotrophobium sp.]
MAFTQAYANDTSAKTGKTLTNQQQKMKDCNAEAKGKALKGADRKAFMKTCLKKDGAAAAESAAPAAAAAPAPAEAKTDKRAAQKEKMKTCNADAKTKGLKGADRKAFMKTCLSAG